MDPFVKRFHPEFFDLWKAGIFKSSNGKPGVCKSKRRRCPSGGNSLIGHTSSATNLISATQALDHPVLAAKRICRFKSRHQELIDERVNETRAKYSELWYSSAQDSPRTRYHIDKRNVNVAEKNERLNGSIGNLETVRKIFTSISSSSSSSITNRPSSLFKLCLKRSEV